MKKTIEEAALEKFKHYDSEEREHLIEAFHDGHAYALEQAQKEIDEKDAKYTENITYLDAKIKELWYDLEWVLSNWDYTGLNYSRESEIRNKHNFDKVEGEDE